MFPGRHYDLITNAGWHPERKVIGLTFPCEYPQIVRDVLEEFHGLHFLTADSPGQDCASGDLHISHNLSRLIDHAEDDIRDRYNVDCFFIGVSHRAYCELYSNNNGIIFSSNIVDGELGFVASDIYSAIIVTVSGIQMQPMLANGKSNVIAYGKTYQANDPKVYRP